MKKLFILLALGFIFSLKGQNELLCGSENSSQPVNLARGNSQGIVFNNPPECIVVRLFFHFVRQDNGQFATGDPNITLIQNYIDQQIGFLHNTFSWRIKFESIGYDFIDNSNFNVNALDDPNYVAGELMDQYSSNNHAIDVFLVSNVKFINSDGIISITGGIAKDIPSKACVVPYSEMHVRPSLLRHELGHCLGLFHTHHGHPSSGGGTPEVATQCEITGDFVCDTPIDKYLFNLITYENYVDSYCQYIGPQNPAPLTNNIMSSFIGLDRKQSCPKNVTTGQIDKIFEPINLQYLNDVYYENSQLDLAIKDNADDYFAEPNWTTSDYDNSPDIWVRNHNGGNPNLHQEPIFNHPVWGDPDVKVRVYNNGCAPNTGTETLTVYWAAPSTWQGWPDNWTGIGNPDEKGTIGTVSVPVIQPGQSAVVTIPWDSDDMPTLPPVTSINTCVLAKIDGGINDPLHSEPHDIWIYSNHVALRNLTYISYASAFPDINPEDYEYSGDYGLIKGFVIENIQPFNDLFDFDITTDPLLLQEAEFYYEVPSALYNHVLNGSPISGISAHKTINNALLITNPQVTIEGFTLNANQRLKVKPGINFLRSEVTHDNFTFKFSQKKHGESKILGSEHYIVQRTERAMFQANSGSDVRVLKGQSVNLLAEDIGENAEYNWFDCDGNLLYSGQDITLTPEESRALQLEVITTSDQYKDYDQKNIVVTDGLICNISPNPASTLTEVCVELSEGTTSAVLMVYNVNHNLVNNYIVQGSGETQVQLDLSSYTQGTYQVVLVIDGVISDVHNIIKQ
ncbi:MAG: hypothetical protein ACPG6V_08355 [Flavobacteriales bacterium]